MTQAEPNGAILLDRDWRTLRMNRAIARLTETFIEDGTGLAPLPGTAVHSLRGVIPTRHGHDGSGHCAGSCGRGHARKAISV